jgi:hypothetical protein
LRCAENHGAGACHTARRRASGVDYAPRCSVRQHSVT